jgi:hypothetical protein
VNPWAFRERFGRIGSCRETGDGSGCLALVEGNECVFKEVTVRPASVWRDPESGVVPCVRRVGVE